MTEEPFDPTLDGSDRAGAGRPASPVSLALDRLQRDPVLFVPFVVAGVCLWLLDWIRRHDPLPTIPGEQTGATVTVAYTGYPTGVPETARALSSLIDLKLPYLVWGLTLEVVAVFVIAAAGTVTIARGLSADSGGTTPRRLLAYVGLVASFDVVFRILTAVVGDDVGLIAGLVLIIPLFVVFVRVFAAPAFIVTGSGPIIALQRSARATRGRGWSILPLVVAFGLAAWLLGLVPGVGTILSTALVGSVHAVTAAVVRETATDGHGGH
ncbi:hypothetical protein [Natrinema limicola]|uniref:Uncharacterized protein n=1 Tax=Natrinema limicola JCM 13563 TaxID=1230457 RepID=M0CJD1_9EURY|nr:hypothetical protein [Natrinema limicola]ELZ21984.1 hypothetical protein C476_06117 [Natrinema limicola JCM 13563]